jgi:hypothetical protein
METTYPATPGFKTGGTSAQAAFAVKEKARVIREKVLAALATQDLTPDECAVIIGEEKHSVRSRFSELVTTNQVFKLAETRKNASGFSAHVHTISQQTKLLYVQHQHQNHEKREIQSRKTQREARLHHRGNGPTQHRVPAVVCKPEIRRG